MELSLFENQKVEGINRSNARLWIGLLMIITGALGLATYLTPCSATYAQRLAFASGAGVAWLCAWLSIRRLPSLFITFIFGCVAFTVWLAMTGPFRS